MKTTARSWCLIIFAGALATANAQTGGVSFNNFGPNWAAPWFGPGSNNTILYGNPELNYLFTVGNTRLAGSGYTVELWGGPSASSMQYLARRTFSTVPALHGCLSSAVTAPISFAVPGQRVSLQMRAYNNQGGTITSFAQVTASGGTVPFALSELFLSPPLDTVANPPVPLTGEGMKAHYLGVDGLTLSLPILTMRTRPDVHIASWVSSRRPVFVGETVTLSIAVPNPADYIQWRFQGVDLPQNNQTLVLNNIQLYQGGTYSAVTRVTAAGTSSWGTNAIEVVVRQLRLTEPRVTSSGAFSALIEGLSNRAAVVEASADLQSWTAVRTQYVAQFSSSPGWCNGCVNSLTFSNPAPLAEPARFHRLRAVP